jgi:hypothetical protein
VAGGGSGRFIGLVVAVLGVLADDRGGLGSAAGGGSDPGFGDGGAADRAGWAACGGWAA